MNGKSTDSSEKCGLFKAQRVRHTKEITFLFINKDQITILKHLTLKRRR